MFDQFLEFAQNHLVLVSIFVVLLLAWLAFETKRNAEGGVTSGEATRMINRDEAVVVDIREPKEYKAGHIAGAVNIPAGKLEKRMNELEKHKDTPVIVVCKSGQTAGQSMTTLKAAGFSKAAKLKGGMAQWQADELPVVRR
ncbi:MULTISPECIES: rhodanese-like domain-containing protein [Larsenimonas]|uniref:Rhodanese-like domain-containing protein n=1 Tax=Larsenimonas suaedae TaxID=1851019 RepID=A0ABU1GRD1_9GAMM|nr:MULTISPECIES: rhodanese-like domain-containing protein [Larsenimonas]MCM2972654.1 rhodanese-like domain-containing protein [Larsenimonas suaedae]MCM5704631.1 rhodanese-like domain-containing protein [Larsenimonas salina]MDR5894549.1 rhodanese-like domain-containing protein [Larsenimonas suaedae]